MTITIAIIGGGAASVSLLAQLTERYIQEKSSPEVQIVVIEKSGHVGPGLAYGTPDNAHIINLSAENMSPVPDEPRHFVNWIQNNEDKWKPTLPEFDVTQCAYPPRVLFGLYLTDFALTTQARAKEHGMTIKFITDEAINLIIGEDKKFFILLSGKNRDSGIFADQVMLCIGHQPSTDYREFIGNSHYCHFPWPVEPPTDLSKEKKIVVIGTRLTAIDIVLSLANQGYNNITMVSHYGFLPYVIGKSAPYLRQFLNLDNIVMKTAHGTKHLSLSELIEMFKKEIETAEEQPFNLDKLLQPVKSSESATKWLRKEIKKAETQIRPWQSVLASLYPIVPSIWNTLNIEDKKEFLEKYYSLWMTCLAAFPIENAKKILALLESRRLNVIGGLQSIQFDDQENCFVITLNNKDIYADYLINGTGAGHDITKTDSKLLQNLLAENLIIPHPLGGIEVDFQTLNIKRNKANPQVTENFFAVGDGTTWGARMATADLGQIGKEAKCVVNSSITQLRKTLSKSNKPISQPSKDDMQIHVRQFLTDRQSALTQLQQTIVIHPISKTELPDIDIASFEISQNLQHRFS